MSWFEKLKLEESLKEIIQDERQGKDFCLDPLRYEDLQLQKNKKALIDEIKNTLSKGNYKVSKLKYIDVPKPNYILRPASRPTIIDWVIYNSVVNFIISKIYKSIPKNSYSFVYFKDKFNKKKNKKKTDYWLEFENDSIKLSKNNKYKYLLVTDITSYFEYINLDVLKERLNMLSNNKDYNAAVNFLIENMLKRWTEEDKISYFSLPQGPTTSSMLGDVYLYPVDKEMNDNNIKFLRFMDDIRLFSKDITELKHSIKTLVISLRKLRLNLNAKKTIIYHLEDPKKLVEIFDPNKELLNIIDKTFRKRNKESIESIIPSLYSLYDKFREGVPFRERYLKFFIGRIIDLMKFRIIPKFLVMDLVKDFLNLFYEKHHLADLFSWFFVVSSKYDKNISIFVKKNLIKFIYNKKNNIYEWQEMWALDTIRQIGKINKTELKKIKKKYSSNNDMCYSQFSLISGKYGNSDEREEVLNQERYKNDLYRTSLLAIQELNKDIIKKSKLYLKSELYYKKYFDNLKSGKYYGFIYNLEKFDLEIEYFSDY